MLSADKARLLPTLAVDGPWLLKLDDDEQRIWVHEFNITRTLRRDLLLNGCWITTAYLDDGIWTGVDDG